MKKSETLWTRWDICAKVNKRENRLLLRLPWMKGTKTKNNFLSLLVSTSYKYRKKKNKWGQKKIYGYEAKCCIFVFCHQTEDYCYKKKNNLCPKLVVLNMILFKLEACHFSKLISTQNWTVLGPITLIIFLVFIRTLKIK